MLIAVPVLLGALARLPLGLLTDRFGGRILFPLLFFAVAVAAALVPSARSYDRLILFAFFLGLAGSSFAIGVGFTSRWFPPEKQGTALGVYGLGNMGHSAAVFLGPVLAAQIGRDAVFYTVAALCAVWGMFFFAAARNDPVAARPASFAAALKILATERLAWALSAFYFVTFGGFVAFSVYLPTLLRDEFALSAADAGLRTAGFVVLATLMRPAGGILWSAADLPDGVSDGRGAQRCRIRTGSRRPAHGVQPSRTRRAAHRRSRYLRGGVSMPVGPPFKRRQVSSTSSNYSSRSVTRRKGVLDSPRPP